MNTPLITVFGATGAQGGGLTRAILADPQRRFRVRAVTRKPDSPAARALAAAGAEIVIADLDDAVTVQHAMEGAHGAFCVTNFWEHFSPAKELAQAHAMAEAAARAAVSHVIWSTLEDTRGFIKPDGTQMPVLGGSYNVPHLDAKGQANRAFVERRVPTTFLYTSFYWDNLIHFGLEPTRAADGRLVFALPMADKLLPGIAAEDIGRCAFGIFAQGSGTIGKAIGIAGEHLSGGQMAEQLGQALGETVVHWALEPEQYRGLGFPGADELGNMFQFKRDFQRAFCGARSVATARELNPQLQSFADWLNVNGQNIPRH
jgi:uncharacterized protein YbjT (DUF2867 family)